MAKLLGVAISTLRNYSVMSDPVKKKTGRSINESAQEHITDFINGLPAHPSHYRYNDAPHRLYLDAKFKSVALLYKQYCTVTKDIPEAKTSGKTFLNIFKTFNIGFRHANSDKCTSCIWFEARDLKNNTDLRKAYIAHKYEHDSRHRFYKSAREEIDPNTLVVDVDLSKVFDMPDLEGGQFYEQQESTYPFGIVNHTDGTMSLCVWSESLARRDTNSINSCLLRVLRGLVNDKNVTKLIVFGDNCAGQNKSLHTILFYNVLLNICPSLVEIELQYIFKVCISRETTGLGIGMGIGMQWVKVWDGYGYVQGYGCVCVSGMGMGMCMGFGGMGMCRAWVCMDMCMGMCTGVGTGMGTGMGTGVGMGTGTGMRMRVAIGLAIVFRQ
jgi:hypothetical protein